MEQPVEQLSSVDVKALLVAWGPLIGTVTGVGGLILGILNWLRTGRLNRRVQANNRASRFEAVHGPSLNDTVAKLKELARNIAITRSSLSSIDEAKTYARDSIRPQISQIENIFTNEVALLGASKLSINQSYWISAADASIWDSAQNHLAKILVASSLDAIPPAISGLSDALNDALKRIQEARESENEISR